MMSFKSQDITGVCEVCHLNRARQWMITELNQFRLHLLD